MSEVKLKKFTDQSRWKRKNFQRVLVLKDSKRIEDFIVLNTVLVINYIPTKILDEDFSKKVTKLSKNIF